MRALVTGAAGFVGAHLADRLLGGGHSVVLVDAFTDFYDPEIKRERMAGILRGHPGTSLIESDLLDSGWTDALSGVDVVFHLGGQPGVQSWGTRFQEYLERNVLATQRLLEAAAAVHLPRLVYASSSSVYGEAEGVATSEARMPAPISPYGVTKLAAEHLVSAYGRAQSLPFVILRYFTVYGPGQRPDMSFHRFIRSIQREEAIEVFGDGEQSRDFTFVSDAVAATVAAGSVERAVGRVLNVGGGRSATLNRCIRLLASIAGREVEVRHLPTQPGDVRHTSADISRAKRELGYAPLVPLEQGLRLEWEWLAEAQPSPLRAP